MKIPPEIKQEHVLCIGCNKPIHYTELGAITKKGHHHKNMVCLIPIAKEMKVLGQ